MRIAEAKVAQLIESEPRTLVLLDEITGEEVTLTKPEFDLMVEFANRMGWK